MSKRSFITSQVPTLKEMMRSGPLLDCTQPGEYSFASGNFFAFATEFPRARMMLSVLCGLKAAEVTIYVHASDAVIAQKFADLFRENVQVCELPGQTALLMGQLIYLAPSGEGRLYVCHEDGFTFLNNFEAVRIRNGLHSFR